MTPNWLARVRHKVAALFRAPTYDYSDDGEETRIYCLDCAAMIVTCESGAFQSRADFDRFIREMRREARVRFDESGKDGWMRLKRRRQT